MHVAEPGWAAAAARMGVSLGEYRRHRKRGERWCGECRVWKAVTAGRVLRNRSWRCLPCIGIWFAAHTMRYVAMREAADLPNIDPGVPIVSVHFPMGTWPAGCEPREMAWAEREDPRAMLAAAEMAAGAAFTRRWKRRWKPRGTKRRDYGKVQGLQQRMVTAWDTRVAGQTVAWTAQTNELRDRIGWCLDELETIA